MMGQLRPAFSELDISEGFEFDTEIVTNEVNFFFFSVLFALCQLLLAICHLRTLHVHSPRRFLTTQLCLIIF